MATEVILEKYGKLNIKEGTNFPLNFNIQNLTKPESTPSSYSKDVTIIGDKEANKILGQAFDVNISDSSFDINKKVPCNVIQDSATVFEGGFFQLLKVTKTGQSLPNGEPKIEYIGRVKSDLMSFFTSIKDNKLTDLKLGGFDTYQQLNKANIKASFTNTVIDKWKYAPLFKAANPSLLKIKEWRPAIFAKVVWDEIHAQNGWQYEFEELEDVKFDKFVIPYTGEFDADEDTKEFATYIGDNGSFYQADMGCAAKTENNGELYKYGINDSEVLKITNDIQDNENQYNLTTNRFTAAFKSDYNFKFSLNISQVLNNTSSELIEVYKENQSGGPTRNLSMSLAYRYVILRADGTTDFGAITSIANTDSNFSTFAGSDPKLPLSPGNTIMYTRDVEFEFDVDLNVGDQVYDIRLIEFWKNTQGAENLIWGYGSILQSTFQAVDVCSIYNINQTDLTVTPDLTYDIGTPIYIQQFIPREIDQRDFVKSIIDVYKLIVDVDPQNDNKLIYKTRDKYYDEGKKENWSKKLNKLKPINIEWLVDKQPKKLKLTYSQDEDEYNKAYFNHIRDVYGEFEFDFGNEYNIGTKKHEIIFSPTPIQHDVGSNMYLPSLPLTDAEDLNIRLLYDGGVRQAFWFLQNDDGSFSSTNESDYPYFGHLDDPVQPSFDMNFGTCEFYFYNSWEFTTNNNLFNLFHRRYISQLTKGRLMTAYFDLTPLDILNTKLNDKIFINDAWWNINRIVDYNANSNSSTKVELVTVDDGLSVMPSRKTGVVKPSPTKPYVGTPTLQYGKTEVFATNTISKGFVGDVYGEDNNISKDAKGVVVGDKNTMGGKSLVVGNKSSDGGFNGKLVVGNGIESSSEYDITAKSIETKEKIKIGNQVITENTIANFGEVLYKARIVQSGTDAPVLTEYINNTGNVITATRGAEGLYSITGFSGALVSGNFEVTISEAMIAGDTAYLSLPTTGNAISVQTYDASGTPKDGVLLGTTGGGNIESYNIITLKKYD